MFHTIATFLRYMITKTSRIYWSCIPIILIPSLRHPDASLDINIHDTYIVVLYLHLAILASIYFVFIGGIYWLLEKFNRKKITWLTITHLITTLVGIQLMTWVPFIPYTLHQTQRSFIYLDSIATYTLLIYMPFLIFGIGQLLFCIQCSIGILYKNT